MTPLQWCSTGCLATLHFHQRHHSRQASEDDKNSLSKHLKMNPSNFYPKLWSASLNRPTLSRIMRKWAQVHTFFTSGEVRDTPHPPLPLTQIRFISPEAQYLCDERLAGWLCRAWLPFNMAPQTTKKLHWKRIIPPGSWKHINLTVINRIHLPLFSLRKQTGKCQEHVFKKWSSFRSLLKYIKLTNEDKWTATGRQWLLWRQDFIWEQYLGFIATLWGRNWKSQIIYRISMWMRSKISRKDRQIRN